MNILITRAVEQLPEFINALSDAGHAPFSLPMIASRPLSDVKFMYDSYDYCVLTSPAAVRFFSAYRGKVRADRYVAVGEKTAKTICEKMDFPMEQIMIPDSFYVSELEKLFSDMDLKGKKVLSPGAKERIKDMAYFFHLKEAHFDAPVLYETVPLEYGGGEIEDFIRGHEIDTITFFSPSAVKAMFKQAKVPENIRIIAIGATTKAAVEAFGRKAICPERQTAESVVELIKHLA